MKTKANENDEKLLYLLAECSVAEKEKIRLKMQREKSFHFVKISKNENFQRSKNGTKSKCSTISENYN